MESEMKRVGREEEKSVEQVQSLKDTLFQFLLQLEEASLSSSSLSFELQQIKQFQIEQTLNFEASLLKLQQESKLEVEEKRGEAEEWKKEAEGWKEREKEATEGLRERSLQIQLLEEELSKQVEERKEEKGKWEGEKEKMSELMDELGKEVELKRKQVCELQEKLLEENSIVEEERKTSQTLLSKLEQLETQFGEVEKDTLYLGQLYSSSQQQILSLQKKMKN